MTATIDAHDVSIVTHAIENVTPEAAELMLAANVKNRRLSQARVNQIANDLIDGRYVFTGDSIKFSVGGELLDGQHRLRAIAQSGVAATLLVIRNLPRKSQSAMDTGKSRNVPDVLRMRGHANVNCVAACAKQLMDYPFGANDRPPSISTMSAIKFIEDHPGIHASAAFATKNAFPTGWMTKSAVATCHYLLGGNEYAAEFSAFIARVRIGADLAEDSPEYALTRWCLKNVSTRGTGQRRRSYDFYWALATTFHASLDGRKMRAVGKRSIGQEQPLLCDISEVPAW